jgi:hypothetical protein
LHVFPEQFNHPSFDMFTTDDSFGGGVRFLSSFRPAAAERLPGESEWLDRAVPTSRRWTCNFFWFDLYGLPGLLWTLAIDLVQEHVLDDLAGLAHRVGLIGPHGGAQVAEEGGALTPAESLG